MVVIIDNNDSFTYNIVEMVRRILDESVNSVDEFPAASGNVKVLPNSGISINDLGSMNPSHLILSPGPGRPEDTGLLPDVVRYFAGRIPILGICLGLQVIAQVFGARIKKAGHLVHGRPDPVTHDGQGLFVSLPEPCRFTRYHSLAVDASSLPRCLQATAYAPDGELMALRHRSFPIYGVQFHPESIGSESGSQLFTNFLSL